MISPAKIAEWKRKADAATEGPWISLEHAGSHCEIRETDTAPGDKHHWPFRVCETIAGQSSPQHVKDFAFIAAARTAVPALIERIEYLEAEIINQWRGLECVADDTEFSAGGLRDVMRESSAALRDALTPKEPTNG